METSQPQVELKPEAASLTMVLEITRADTGKIETVEVVCTPAEPPKEI